MSAELVQLAGTWDFLSVPPDGLMAEQKVDGWRAAYIRDWQGRPGLYTRNGQSIEGAGHILHEIARLEALAGEPLMLDGEFQVASCLSATKRWCERGWKGGGEAGTLFLFDAMPLSQWKAGGSDEPLYRRKARLVEMMRVLEGEGEPWEWRPGSRGKVPPEPALAVLEDHWCADRDQVMDLARRTWAAGGEGLMLKEPEAPYRRTRASWWRKVKSPKLSTVLGRRICQRFGSASQRNAGLMSFSLSGKRLP